MKEHDLLVIMSNPSAPARTTGAPLEAASSLLPNTSGFTARTGMKLHEIPVRKDLEKNPVEGSVNAHRYRIFALACCDA